MTEPDVAITDLLLAALCGFFALRLWRLSSSGDDSIRTLWVAFYCAVGLAALLGGVTHGFFHQSGTPANRMLWLATMACVGATGTVTWIVSSKLWMGVTGQRVVGAVALILLAIYVYQIVFVDAAFKYAIFIYVPPTVFLLASFSILYARGREQAFLLGIFGVLMTFAAAALQQAQVGLHPKYFNHNAVYHLAQAAALSLIYLGATQSILRRP